MAEIGKYNHLSVVKEVDFGLYLDGGEHGEILLPKRYVPNAFEIGEKLEVFVYLDSEDRIIATTEKPFLTLNEFALLRVVAVNNIGAFVDWGLSKDLLVPFREQAVKMIADNYYIVCLYLDFESKRLVGSTKLDKFLDNIPVEYEEGQEVELMITNKTDLGYRAIIEDAHWGVLYANEVFQELNPGQRIFGFIKKIRDDEKIDLTLHKPGYEKIDDFSDRLLSYLNDNNGHTPLNDKSPAQEIYSTFKISKKTFKKAVGTLYKKRLISLSEKGIDLV